jgi:hypothetical protein
LLFILWYVYPLLGNDRGLIRYTTAVARLWLVNGNRVMVFSAWSTPMSAQATNAQQEKNGVFCAVRSEMLKQDELVDRVS